MYKSNRTNNEKISLVVMWHSQTGIYLQIYFFTCYRPTAWHEEYICIATSEI